MMRGVVYDYIYVVKFLYFWCKTQIRWGPYIFFGEADNKNGNFQRLLRLIFIFLIIDLTLQGFCHKLGKRRYLRNTKIEIIIRNYLECEYL